MNKRIEELAKQSGFEEDGGHLLIHGVYVTNRLEKFAKLMIYECIISCERNIFRNMDHKHNDAVRGAIGEICKSFDLDIEEVHKVIWSDDE